MCCLEEELSLGELIVICRLKHFPKKTVTGKKSIGHDKTFRSISEKIRLEKRMTQDYPLEALSVEQLSLLEELSCDDLFRTRVNSDSLMEYCPE